MTEGSLSATTWTRMMSCGSPCPRAASEFDRPTPGPSTALRFPAEPFTPVGWYMWPLAGQEEVAEAEKVWLVAKIVEDAYEDYRSFFFMEFDDETSEAEIASLITRLLYP
jgi:hypothetical protein